MTLIANNALFTKGLIFSDMSFWPKGFIFPDGGSSIYCSYAILGSEFNKVSDERIKTNIENIDSSIDIINQLRPVTFNYKKKINKYGIAKNMVLLHKKLKI